MSDQTPSAPNGLGRLIRDHVLKEEKAPLSLHLLGGMWLIGRRVPVEEKTSALSCAACAKRERDGREVTLSPVFEYQGQLVTDPRTKQTGVAQRVVPVSGLISLRSLRFAPAASVALDELAPEERRNIVRIFDQCEEMVGAARAEMAGITRPKLVLP